MLDEAQLNRIQDPHILLGGPVGGTVQWLQTQRRQYALNRALIAALVKGDDKQALVLVNEGADPNTRYKAMPVPLLFQLVKQWLHRSPAPVNDSVTALSIACGGLWGDEVASYVAQCRRPDDAQLVQAMLTHGAKVKVKDEIGASPLMWAAIFSRRNSARLLLEHGANPNLAIKSWKIFVIWAQHINRTEVITLLKQYGAREPGKRP
jgi:ankyrin repeat protein